MEDYLVIKLQQETETAVKYLQVDAGVRYWEDATVDGVEDEDGSRIPFKDGDRWKPIIALVTGMVVDWPKGVEADIHYKVCDDGKYTLIGLDHQPAKTLDDYVPKIMCPGGDGYGDYIIMKIDGNGRIENWKPDLGAFQS